MIETTKYYQLSELPGLHPIFKARKQRFLYDIIGRGQLRATNTSGSDKTPRYLILGSDIIAYLHGLNVPTVIVKNK